MKLEKLLFASSCCLAFSFLLSGCSMGPPKSARGPINKLSIDSRPGQSILVRDVNGVVDIFPKKFYRMYVGLEDGNNNYTKLEDLVLFVKNELNDPIEIAVEQFQTNCLYESIKYPPRSVKISGPGEAEIALTPILGLNGIDVYRTVPASGSKQDQFYSRCMEKFKILIYVGKDTVPVDPEIILEGRP